jgi:hypothetical protein
MLSTRIRIISDRLGSRIAGGSPTMVRQAATKSAGGIWARVSEAGDLALLGIQWLLIGAQIKAPIRFAFDGLVTG